MILDMKKKLISTFHVTNLDLLHYFPDVQVLQFDDGIFFSQHKRALDLLRKVRMEDCKPCLTPFQFEFHTHGTSMKVDASLYRPLEGQCYVFDSKKTGNRLHCQYHFQIHIILEGKSFVGYNKDS